MFGDGEERHSSRNSLSNSGKLKIVHRKDTASSFWLVWGNKDQIFAPEVRPNYNMPQMPTEGVWALFL